jgi:predicted permease
MALVRRILNLFSRDRIGRDIDAEIEAHIAMRTEDNIAAGMSPEEARRDARLRFGNPVVQRERTTAADAALALDRLAADFRYALRQFRKFPLFAATTILTLALGIGATTAVFSAMNAVILRWLPVPDPQRLVYLMVPDGQPRGATNTGDSDSSFSLPVFQALRQNRHAFSDLMAFAPLSTDKVDVRSGNEAPEQAAGEMVSGNFFSGLGVSMAHGRAFAMADESDHAAVAILSYAYWTRRFSRNPDILGQTLFVRGIPFTIVGVTAKGFPGVEPGYVTDFWIPLERRAELNPWGSGIDVSLYGSPNWWCLRLIARLAPGRTMQQALAEITPTFRAAAYAPLGRQPAANDKLSLVLAPAKGLEGLGDYDDEPIRILMALVALVLLIACSNVALLIVARNTSRQREFSLRMALGASRSSLLRQLFTESGLLVLAGALLGWAFAVAGTRALASWSHIETGLAPDGTVLLFTTAVSVLAALVFGLAPLRTATSAPVTGTLRTTSGTSAHTGRGGAVILMLQVALCFTLLAAAGLLLRTLLNYERTNLGMRMQGLVVFGNSPQQTHTSEERFAFYRDLLDRMRALPQVEAATLMDNRLGSGWSDNDEPTLDGVTHSFDEIPLRANLVGPDYLHTLGIPILAGRDIADSDTPTSPRVAIVNETFVRKLLPNTNPLGHRLGKLEDPKAPPFTIVGVAGDSKYRSVDERPRAMAYYPFTQMGDAPPSMQVELRVEGDPLAILHSVERAVHSIDPNLPLEKPMTQAAVFEESYSDQRLFARLSIFFGVLAALLVAIGLYGMLSYRVSRRTTEIGVRMAMGARRQQILGMVMRQSLRISAVGIAVGVPLALLTTHFMASMLYNLAPTDTLTFCAALLGILVVGLAAGFIPARRAASIDPMQALRSE